MATTDTAVGRNVRAEMARHLLTQADVAKVLNLSQAAVGARLRGETDFKFTELKMLADRLQISVSQLVGEA